MNKITARIDGILEDPKFVTISKILCSNFVHLKGPIRFVTMIKRSYFLKVL